VNFNWGSGSPSSLIGVDTFSVKWSGNFSFEAGNYEFTTNSDDGVRLRIDGVLVLDKWITQSPTTYKVTRTMTAGTHLVQLEYFENTGGAVAQLSWQKSSNSSPFVAVNLPGTIQAENYDLGGQGVAYNDTTTGNSGASYRSDAVDIAPSPEGGYSVGWVKSGEWLKYTVNVATAGTYALSLRVATTQTRSLRVEVDGLDRTGTWSIPNTGGYSRYQTVSKAGLSLTAGKHVIRVYFLSDDIDLNWIRVQ
jgi:hypothetical protein